MIIDKIVCLFLDEDEKYFFQNAHSRFVSDIPLYFINSVSELKKFIDKKSFIVLSVDFADKNISDTKQLLDDFPHLTFNFFHNNSSEALPLNVLDLTFDYPYPQQVTKPESGYFLLEQLKKRLEKEERT
jgi:hypothetical protein